MSARIPFLILLALATFLVGCLDTSAAPQSFGDDDDVTTVEPPAAEADCTISATFEAWDANPLEPVEVLVLRLPAGCEGREVTAELSAELYIEVGPSRSIELVLTTASGEPCLSTWPSLAVDEPQGSTRSQSAFSVGTCVLEGELVLAIDHEHAWETFLSHAIGTIVIQSTD